MPANSRWDLIRGLKGYTIMRRALGFDHTESGLPRRAAICAHGGKALELRYVRLYHPRQTEGGLTRRTSLDRGGQRIFLFWREICLAGSTEWRRNLMEKKII